jgi:hypothetical protein
VLDRGDGGRRIGANIAKLPEAFKTYLSFNTDIAFA